MVGTAALLIRSIRAQEGGLLPTSSGCEKDGEMLSGVLMKNTEVTTLCATVGPALCMGKEQR